MELIVIRHGETVENVRRICQGHSEGELTPRGVLQAEELRLRLEGEHFDVVFSSDLQRACHTAQIIFGQTKEIICDHRLRERYLGNLQGRELECNVDFNDEIDSAESISQMFERVCDFLNEIKEQYIGKRVGIISHGITIKVIVAICEGRDSIQGMQTVGNCSVTRVKL